MDKRKIANQRVKDSLSEALIKLFQKKKWSSITVSELIKEAGVARASFYRNFSSIEDIIDYGVMEMMKKYNEENPSKSGDYLDEGLILFNFIFFKKYADLILSYHHTQAPQTLLTVIEDFMIDAYGDMPANSISKYELYYYCGAFYNMVIHWLENGAKESVEDMAKEFLRITYRK